MSRSATIVNEEKIKHTLSHMIIGEQIYENTIDTQRFSVKALDKFFEGLRDGHRNVLRFISPDLAKSIGDTESDELDHLGKAGKFVGRLSIRESGIVAIESALHANTDARVKQGFVGSIESAFEHLK